MRSYMLLKEEKEETEDGEKIKIKWSEHVLLWLEGWSLRFRQITLGAKPSISSEHSNKCQKAANVLRP